jgi:hypothetical protein
VEIFIGGGELGDTDGRTCGQSNSTRAAHRALQTKTRFVASNARCYIAGVDERASSTQTDVLMRRISSRWTFFPKYLLPALMSGLMAFAVWRATGWGERALYVVIFGCAVLYTVAFAWDLCHASTDGERLLVKGPFRHDTIPLHEIQAIAGFTRSKWPHIDIVLRRPTALGAELRIMPADFWPTYDLLAAHAESKRYDNEYDAAHRSVSGKYAPLAFGLALAFVVIVIAVTKVFF